MSNTEKIAAAEKALRRHARGERGVADELAAALRHMIEKEVA